MIAFILIYLYSDLLKVTSLCLTDDLQAGIYSQLSLLSLVLPLAKCLDHIADILDSFPQNHHM